MPINPKKRIRQTPKKNEWRLAYDLLQDHYGPQDWWPAKTKFEIVIGAILVQNTAWRNVVRTIANLRQHKALSMRALASKSTAELQTLLKPIGSFRLKTDRLQSFLSFVQEEHDGSLAKLFRLPTDELREALLSVRGIGPETADAILLYAAERPVFVVDAYATRVATRHGWAPERVTYHELQKLFLAALPQETELFNEYHALLVEVGRLHCHRTKPKCKGCPLEKMLPKSGPRCVAE